MLVSDICDIVNADMGEFLSPDFVARAVLDVAIDFCSYSMTLNKYVRVLADSADAEQSGNYAQSFVVSPYTDTEPCGIFGLIVNGCKLASAERDTLSPSGASTPLYHNGGIFYKFSDPTTCLIHPLPSGGDVSFYTAFQPVVSASQIPDELWDKHSFCLINGVKGRLLLNPGYKSFNPQMAQVNSSLYTEARRKARSQVNRTIIGESII